MPIEYFPFQREGGEWLSKRKNALLADEMGLGKTAQAILGCDLVGAENVTVLCPAIAQQTWAKEFPKFSAMDRPVSRIDWKTLKKGVVPPNGVHIVSYDYAANHDVLGAMWQRRPDVLICDESHYLASREAKRTRLVFGPACRREGGLTELSERNWLLSATPMKRDPSRLWPMMRALFPDRIRDPGKQPFGFENFLDRYTDHFQMKMGWNNYRTVVKGGKNLDDLRERLRGIVLRRRADVIKGMPDIFFSDLPVDDIRVDYSDLGIDPRRIKRLTAQWQA